MSGKTARSGEGGKAVVGTTLVARITTITVNTATTTSDWGDSDSGSFENTKPARRNANGNMTGMLDTVDPVYDLFDVGDVVEVQFWEDGNAETPAVYWHLECVVITSFDLTIDPNTKEVVGWTANWKADGRWYTPSTADESMNKLGAAKPVKTFPGPQVVP
jgi:hypothetical protein